MFVTILTEVLIKAHDRIYCISIDECKTGTVGKTELFVPVFSVFEKGRQYRCQRRQQ